MAQHEEEQTEIHVHETLTLCLNNCGFFGDPATNNLCRPCFKRASNSARSQVAPTRAGEKEDKIDGTVASAEATAAVPVARKVNRCSVCQKRVGLVGFRCRCGDLFCGEHRYSDRHGCGFDYKAAARAAISRANPVVRSAKIVRF